MFAIQPIRDAKYTRRDCVARKTESNPSMLGVNTRFSVIVWNARLTTAINVALTAIPKRLAALRPSIRMATG